MFAYYWVGECSNVKHITVLKEDHRDLYSGGTLIAEFEIKGLFNELKLTKHITGKLCELEQAIYWAKQLLKFLKEQKVI